jgi:hypothetical protein
MKKVWRLGLVPPFSVRMALEKEKKGGTSDKPAIIADLRAKRRVAPVFTPVKT